AAARKCQQFCRSELDLFQRVLGADCTVGRVEHMLDGARRCVYVITPLGQAGLEKKPSVAAMPRQQITVEIISEKNKLGREI
ncbi:MAG TPA: hypothetical protein VF670_12545, partial [Duganella sp.]